ncbi:helix-turn-helix domain-containing protein [Streptomyces olivoreticuli]
MESDPDTTSGLPRTYTPAEVATSLGCSAWWVTEQVRRGRLPAIKSGSGYRFTKAHVEEIFSILEQRPQQPENIGLVANLVRQPAETPASTAAVRLHARPPRRARNGVPGRQGLATAPESAG